MSREIIAKMLVGRKIGNAIVLKYLGMTTHRKNNRPRMLIRCQYEWSGKVCNNEAELDYETVVSKDQMTPLGCLSCRRRFRDKLMKGYVEHKVDYDPRLGIRDSAFANPEYWDYYLLGRWENL